MPYNRPIGPRDLRDYRNVVTEEDFIAWVTYHNRRMADEHAKRMAAWKYLQSEAYQQQVRLEILRNTTSSIDPPWED